MILKKLTKRQHVYRKQKGITNGALTPKLNQTCKEVVTQKKLCWTG